MTQEVDVKKSEIDMRNVLALQSLSLLAQDSNRSRPEPEMDAAQESNLSVLVACGQSALSLLLC